MSRTMPAVVILAACLAGAARGGPADVPLPEGALRLGRIGMRHPARIEALAFSPDGKVLASADSWGRVRLWSDRTGERQRAWPKGTGTAVAFSPDGKLLATGGKHDSVRLWRMADGAAVRTLRDSSEGGLAFSPGGKLVACGDRGGIVLLLDASNGQVVRRLQGLPPSVRSLAFSADGKSVAAGQDTGSDGDVTIVIWDTGSGRQRCRINDKSQHCVLALSFSRDGKMLASSSCFRVSLWDAQTGKMIRVLHEDARDAVAFSADGSSLIVGGRPCCIWDVKRQKLVRRMGQGYNPAHLVAVSPDGKRIASNAWNDGGIRLWDAASGTELFAQGTHRDEVRGVAVSHDGKVIATGSGGDGTVRLWDAATGKELCVLRLRGERDGWSRDNGLQSLAFAPDGGSLLAAGQQWQTATGKELPSLPGELPGDSLGNRRGPEVFCPNGNVVFGLSSQENAGIRVWDCAAKREVRRIMLPNGLRWTRPSYEDLASLAVSPDGKLLATGYVADPNGWARKKPAGPSVQLWDLATGKQVRGLRPNYESPGHLAFAPDGRLLASCGTLREAPELWDVGSGKRVRRLTGHEDKESYGAALNPVAFSPDGQLLAAGGKGNAVVLWETVSGKEVRVLRGHEGPVRSLAFAPDGSFLVSGGGDATTMVWPVVPRGGAAVKPGDWNESTPERLWASLAREPAEAYPALWSLLASPDRAVALLRARLRPDAVVGRQGLERLVADLGSRNFRTRRQAAEELRRLGGRAESALRRALQGKPQLEQRRRVEELLAELEAGTPPGELRDRRAIQALERMATPAAESILEALARGSAGGVRTEAARGALRRLEQRRRLSKRQTLGPVGPCPVPQGRATTLHSHDREVHPILFSPAGRLLSLAQLAGVTRVDVLSGRRPKGAGTRSALPESGPRSAACSPP